MDGVDLPTSDPSAGDVPPESGDRPVGSDALARAIAASLATVMRDFDAAADGAGRSQDGLARSIDRLTGELDKLLEDAPPPFVVQHAAKISSVRKRVAALNLMLRSVQRRIDNIDRMLTAGPPNDSVPPDIAGQQH